MLNLLHPRPGNTPLMLAATLGRLDLVLALLKRGASVLLRNRQGWSPLNEAMSLGSRSLIRMLFLHTQRQIKRRLRLSTLKVLRTLEDLEDFSVEIHWEFHSWLPLVSRFLPNDTLRIWKRGHRIRADSSLLSLSDQCVRKGDHSVIVWPDVTEGLGMGRGGGGGYFAN